MNHPEIELDQLVAGELDAVTSTRIHAHLDVCPACYEQFIQLQAVELDLQQLPRLTASPTFVAEVLARTSLPARPGWRFPVIALVVGLLALLPSWDVVLSAVRQGLVTPSSTDWVDWFTWVEQLSGAVEVTLILGLCAVAVACVLVVMQTLASPSERLTGAT